VKEERAVLLSFFPLTDLKMKLDRKRRSSFPGTAFLFFQNARGMFL
jgi:hypothetical protein